MGWNDHVDYRETECRDCGETDIWEFWNDIAKERYGGENKRFGDLVGIDERNSGRCPHCGSTRGEPTEP